MIEELKGLLTRRIGPVPVWVYASVGVLGLAWWLRHRKAQDAADETTDDAAGGVFPYAQPMQYSRDYLVNGSSPVPSTPVPVPTPPTVPTPVPPGRTTSETHVVQQGETLYKIAQRFLGDGNKYPVIYGANAPTIEAWARRYGHASSDGGHWIFPGEPLVIPR